MTTGAVDQSQVRQADRIDHDPTRSASTAPSRATGSLHLSLSEIAALCTKATRGAGFDWGHAEEAGHAAAWLALAGLPGPAMLCALLDDPGLAAPVPVQGRWRAARPQCPLRTGVALQDHATLPEGPGMGPLVISRLAHPGLILPFVAQAARWRGTALRVAWPGALAILPPGPPIGLPEGDWQSTAVSDITLTPTAIDSGDFGDARGSIPEDRHTHNGAITLDTWQRLDALALRTTVPASDQSRVGAGATGGDND